jgi:hypothetical protein
MPHGGDWPDATPYTAELCDRYRWSLDRRAIIPSEWVGQVAHAHVMRRAGVRRSRRSLE